VLNYFCGGREYIMSNENIEENVEVRKESVVVEKKSESLMQTIKFTLFSISAVIIQTLSFTILSLLVFHDAENEYGWSYFISLALSVLWNFTLNREFTFKSANNVPIAMLKVLGFYAVFTPATIFGGQALVNAGWNNFLVFVLTMLLNFVLEFLYCKFVVFRNSINTNKRANKESK
jgi:putative flippase GtrA